MQVKMPHEEDYSRIDSLTNEDATASCYIDGQSLATTGT